MTIIHAAPVVCFDTETFPIGPYAVIPQLVCVSYATDGEAPEIGVVSHFGDRNRQAVEDMLTISEQWGTIIAAHNAVFDACVLSVAFPDLFPRILKAIEDGRLVCTELREKMLNLADHGGLESLEFRGVTKNFKYGLADLVAEKFGRDRRAEKKDPTAWRTNFGLLDGLDPATWPPEARAYAIEDSTDALELYHSQEARRAVLMRDKLPSDPLAAAPLSLTAGFLLNFWAARGFEVDGLAVEEVAQRIDAARAPEKMAPLYAAGILNPAVPAIPYARGVKNADGSAKMKAPVAESLSKKKLVEYAQGLAARLGFELARTDPSATHPNGQPSVNGEFLEDHAHKDPLLALYKTRVDTDKLFGTYIPPLRQALALAKETGNPPTVWSSYVSLVSTGRTSSRASKLYPSTNIQNQDPEIRGCFVARAGHVLCSIDYAALELCTWAQTCYRMFGHSTMRDIINRGIGPHDFLGAQIAASSDPSFAEFCGSSDKYVRYEKFAGLKKVPEAAAFFKHFRTFAKPTGLGYPGGLGATTFIQFAKTTYGVLVDEAQAKELRNIWLDTFPEARQFFKYVDGQLGDLHNSGDHRNEKKYRYISPAGMIRSGAIYTAACNGLGLQTPAAEGAKRAIAEISKALFIEGYGRERYGFAPEEDPYGHVHPMAFIHDETITEIEWDAERTHAWAYAIAKIQVAAMQEVCPDVKIAAEPALMARWDKRAETVFGANGKLAIWSFKQKEEA